MKTAEEIAIEWGLCSCEEIYTIRKLTSPDCPLHAFQVEQAMEEYANQFKQPITEQLADRLANEKFPVIMEVCNGGPHNMYGMCDTLYYERQAYKQALLDHPSIIGKLEKEIKELKEHNKYLEYQHETNLHKEYTVEDMKAIYEAGQGDCGEFGQVKGFDYTLNEYLYECAKKSEDLKQKP